MDCRTEFAKREYDELLFLYFNYYLTLQFIIKMAVIFSIFQCFFNFAALFLKFSYFMSVKFLMLPSIEFGKTCGQATFFL